MSPTIETTADAMYLPVANLRYYPDHLVTEDSSEKILH